MTDEEKVAAKMKKFIGQKAEPIPVVESPVVETPVTELAHEAPPTLEQAGLTPEQQVEIISKEKPDLTDEQKQYWTEVFSNQQELNKSEHVTVDPMNLKVGDVIAVNGGKIGNYQVKDYFRIKSIDKSGPNNVEIGTESVDGQNRGVIIGGMFIDKNGPPIEVIKLLQEAQSTPVEQPKDETQEDVFKRIARENAEARGEFAEKQQKTTSQILEEMKGKTIGDLKQALGIRNDYVITQIGIYKEFVDQAESQGFKREAEKAQLQEMQKEQEENAAKSRELLSRQSYEIYE